jgi:anti-sigma regulatory factor (Ser/Thr protein kinase)
LHALQLFSAELANVLKTGEQRRLAKRIVMTGNAMGELLDALLDISRLDMAGFTVRRRHFALAPLLQRVVAAHERLAQDKGLTMQCDDTDAWIDSDPQLLERILHNLLANAVRYTTQGSIGIETRRSGESLRIEVRDTGIGIAEEHLPNIFQEFYQVANDERDLDKGLGLGLAIVDRLAKSLQHRVSVASRPGHGTTFTVVVPRVAADEAAVDAADAALADDLAARVLFVGAGDAVGDNLVALVRDWGCAVSVATDNAAIDKFLLGEPRPDVVLCDDSRLAVVAAALGRLPAPPPLLLLGDLPPKTAAGTIAGRLSKPVRPSRLRSLLRHLLEDRDVAAVAPAAPVQPAKAATP